MYKAHHDRIPIFPWPHKPGVQPYRSTCSQNLPRTATATHLAHAILSPLNAPLSLVPFSQDNSFGVTCLAEASLFLHHS